MVASIKKSNYVNKKLAEEVVTVHFKGTLCPWLCFVVKWNSTVLNLILAELLPTCKPLITQEWECSSFFTSNLIISQSIKNPWVELLSQFPWSIWMCGTQEKGLVLLTRYVTRLTKYYLDQAFVASFLLQM